LGDRFILHSLRNLPFRYYIFLKTLYISIISALVVYLGTFHFSDIPMDLSKNALIVIVILIASGISAFYNLLMVIDRMLGSNMIFNIITGKYHQPVEEERIFMFLDMVSSTAVAERIGHIQFYKFLNEVFTDITEYIVNSGGEIYKYVGDEVIISWPVTQGLRKNRCTELYFKVSERLHSHRLYYENKYNVSPYFRAGMHIGKVIVGQLGKEKRELAFLGDTVNTTARIQGMCKLKQQDLLISEALYLRLPHPETYRAHSFGLIHLRGRSKEIRIYSLQKR